VSVIHLLEFFYAPRTGPWWNGAIWGNVFVIPVAAALAYGWSRTKFWPLRPIRHGIEGLHRKVDAHHARAEAHAQWMARTQAAMHEHVTGHPAPTHPHFDLKEKP
jgi:hypothetical protein